PRADPHGFRARATEPPARGRLAQPAAWRVGRAARGDGPGGGAVIVAIDGPAGSGKSAGGRRVAEALGLPFVDSGLLYRVVGNLALERGVPLDDARALSRLAEAASVRIDGRRVHVDGRDVSGQVYAEGRSEAASQVAQFAGVRRAVVVQLRA